MKIHKSVKDASKADHTITDESDELIETILQLMQKLNLSAKPVHRYTNVHAKQPIKKFGHSVLKQDKKKYKEGD